MMLRPLAIIAIIAAANGTAASDAPDMTYEEILAITPAVLRALALPEFCYSFGAGMRDKRLLPDHGELDEIPEFVQAEAKRRRLIFNMRRVLSQEVAIGDTDCQLLAIAGEPVAQRSTVVRSGRFTDYIFRGGVTVTTTNGRVSSFSTRK